MNPVAIALFVCAAYRVKYPGHSYNSSPQAGFVDVMVKALILANVKLYQETMSAFHLYYLFFSILVKCSPWFVILSLIPMHGYWNLLNILAIYGLEQQPWNKHWVYSVQKYLIFAGIFFGIASG